MEPVYSRVARSLSGVRSSVADLEGGDDPAVTRWSAGQLRTWSSRPWNHNGEQLPLVHHASVDVEVEFRDFAVLSGWVSAQVASSEGFHVTNIRWTLTAERKHLAMEQARTSAVRDALDRARSYAAALGLADIQPVAIADAGMLGGGQGSIGPAGKMAMLHAAVADDEAGIDFSPRDIEVTASVDARFVANAAEEVEASDLEVVDEPDLEVGVGEFRDDDPGYLQWLDTHPDGYVINILRSYSPNAARLHRASCWTITGLRSKGASLTGQYVKVCAEQLAELDRWATRQVGQPIARCGTCRPKSSAAVSAPAREHDRAVVQAKDVRHQVNGPTADSALVEAWADDYIRFENLPGWQLRLRDEIRRRCRELVPASGEVMHATFFGAKHPRGDVENVLLYNIDTFKTAGANGIRFEYGAGVPAAADGTQYAYGYRYSLASAAGTFTQWQPERVLAAFDWTDLGAFASEKQLAQVWLALSRGDIGVLGRAAPETPFALKLQIRPPTGRTPVWGALVKGIFDGVICALQAHTDSAVLPEVTARLATILPADAAEIEEHLVDQRRAVLGVVHRLVAPYRSGVKWDPADHLCVAGEVIAGEPVDGSWAIKGEVIEVRR
ncbi:hypothetical protein MMUR_26410 [Mycolicibacterium murale]|uniref:Uncharacterized protein n=2 Tax=Mycolicibacterium murale TaxID=182220 RepID=A0A7I9WL86_9MYCO|nr:hypothetical protein MMUR_26410 [Mycolicibacterium murale]